MSPSRRPNPACAVAGMLALAAACGDSAEPARITLPVVIDATRLATVTTDLGYQVTLTTLRAALQDLQLTTGGKAHAAARPRGLRGWLLPAAHAHPGHAAGGEVTGELRGPLLLDFALDGAAVGVATLLPGRYAGANFTFRTAGPADALAAGDLLPGHTVELAGTAGKAGRSVPFHALIRFDDGTRMVGAAFDFAVSAETRSAIALSASPADPTDTADTLFGGVDFHALPGATEGRATIRPGEAAHNLLVRSLQRHDFYLATPRP